MSTRSSLHECGEKGKTFQNATMIRSTHMHLHLTGRPYLMHACQPEPSAAAGGSSASPAGRPILKKSPRVLFLTPGVVKIGFLTPKYSDFNRENHISTDF